MHKIIMITSFFVLSLLNSPEVQAMQRTSRRWCPGAYNWSSLHLAAKYGKTEQAQSLITTNPELVHTRTLSGETPLLIAAQYGHAAIVALLIASADINAVDNCGDTALAIAMKNKQTVIAGMLLDAKADPNQGSSLHWAVAHELMPEARRLINTGADANARPYLLMAASRGNLAMIGLLLSAGANVNAADRVNGTPLHGAVCSGHSDAAALLISAGADIHAIDCYGRTPLHFAASINNTQFMELLLKYGAASDLNVKDNRGNTPLLKAVKAGHETIALMLVAAGADVNCIDPEMPVTPLHHAAQAGHRHLVRALLDAEANMQLTDVNPLLTAIDGGNCAIVHQLIRAGAPVNDLDPRNTTPSSSRQK
jgi:ankyrin repeat protein